MFLEIREKKVKKHVNMKLNETSNKIGGQFKSGFLFAIFKHIQWNHATWIASENRHFVLNFKLIAKTELF